MLSIVIPVYNEGPRIYRNLHHVHQVLQPVGPIEILVVNDGSSDNSWAEIERAAQDIPVLKPINLPHAGKGEALRQGTRQAQGDCVTFLDADLDLPAEQIILFIALQKTHRADAVIGSKMHPDSTVDYPPLRRIYSWGYYILVRTLFGLPIRDTQTGLKLVKRDLLMQALDKTELKGFAFDLELLVRLVQVGAKMIEAPVVVDYHMKFGGIGAKAIWGIARDTWITWLRVRQK